MKVPCGAGRKKGRHRPGNPGKPIRRPFDLHEQYDLLLPYLLPLSEEVKQRHQEVSP